jgi:hypothetical protein
MSLVSIQSQVFISYFSADRDLAEKLAGKLRAAAPNLDVVIDKAIDEEASAVAGGAYLLPYIGNRLRSANAVIPLLTKSYADSDPCWLEVSAALAMEKVVPVNVDPALSPANLDALVGQKKVPTLSAAWLGKDDANETSHETRVFTRLARDVEAMCKTSRPFSDWETVEAKRAKELAANLADELRPNMFKLTGLVWSHGALGRAQRSRFFLAISSMAVAVGDDGWDISRRKVLKALAEDPLKSRVRAEALMGLVGELMSPSDRSEPISAKEHWEFVGDLALPIDKDISRFAYTKAGNVPEELRGIFDRLKPRAAEPAPQPKGRVAGLLLGAVSGGVAGLAIGYYLGLVPRQTNVADIPPSPAVPESPSQAEPARSQPQQSKPSQAVSPQAASPRATPPQTAPPKTEARPSPRPPATSSSPTPAPPPPPPPSPQPPPTLTVSARGLEVSVRDQVERLGLPEESWTDVYSQVISLNLDTLCTPAKWQAAEAAGKKPLDIITLEDQIVWPTDVNLSTKRSLLECPSLASYSVTTSIPG